MSDRSEKQSSVPAWWTDVQRQFGAMLRTPLDRKTGQLCADEASYPRRLVDEIGDVPKAKAALDARERLAVYQRQYWFRLFTVLQEAFPLVTRLYGHFTFNEVATRYLTEVPPTTASLEDVTLGFERYVLSRTNRTRDDRHDDRHDDGVGQWLGVDVDLLDDAVRLDGAFQRIWLAPSGPSLELGPDAAEHLPSMQLRWTRAATVVELHHPLIELRTRVLREHSEAPVSPPPRLRHVEHWLLWRTALERQAEPGTSENAPSSEIGGVFRRHSGGKLIGALGIRQQRLEALEARLLGLLSNRPVAQALTEFETTLDGAAPYDLADRVQRWLAHSVERGVWAAPPSR